MASQKKKVGFFKATLFYALVITGGLVFFGERIPLSLQIFLKDYWFSSSFIVLGSWISLYGLYRIVIHQVFYQSGQRLKAKELKTKGGELNFENVRGD